MIRERYSSRKFEKRILMYLLLVSLLPVLILGSVSYFIILRSATNQRNASNQSELMQVMQYTDNALENIKEYYGTVVVSKEVEQLMELSDTKKNYPLLQAFTDKMVNNVTFVHYIESYNLINFKYQWVCGNQGIYELETIKNRRELMDVFETAREMPIYWLNHMNEDWSSEYPQVELSNLSLIYRLPLLSGNKYAMLAINMNKNEIENLLVGNRSFGAMIVLDSNGCLLHGSGTELDQAAIRECERLDESPESGGQILEGSFHSDGKTYHLSKAVSETSEWTYIAYYDKQLNREGAAQIMLVAVGVAVLMLVFILGISLFGTRQIYKPVQNTFDNIRSYFMAGEGNEKPADEFVYLEQGVNHLYAHNIELAGTVEMQKEQLTEVFVLRLMRGQLTAEAIRVNAGILGFKQQPYMAIMLVSCAVNREKQQLSDTEEDLMYLTLARDLPEQIRSLLLCAPVSNYYNIILVTGADSEKHLEEHLDQLYKMMNTYTADRFECAAEAGISRAFTQLVDFRNAYHEAIEALKVEHQNKSDNLTYFSDIVQADHHVSTYNLIMQTQIKDAVDKCDEKRAYTIVDQFIAEIGDNKTMLNEQYFFMYRFMLAILVVAADAGLNINKLYSDTKANLFQQFSSLHSWDDIADFYKTVLIKPMIVRLKDVRKNSRTVMMERIEQIVTETAGDITLAECADRIQCHANYIWRIMKEQRGQTFSEYIAQVRMERAKELLLQTGLPVAEIAVLLNFTNSQNFIRYFKKHAGVTPGQYRKQESAG